MNRLIDETANRRIGETVSRRNGDRNREQGTRIPFSVLRVPLEKECTMIKNYLKIAIRNLLRKKGYTLINIFGLAIGIGCAVFTLLYVRYQLSYDRYNTKAYRIYRVVNHMDLNGLSPVHIDFCSTPPPLAPFLKNNYPEVENAVRLLTALHAATIRYGDKSIYDNSVFYADSTFFDIFTFHFFSGDSKTALDEPNSVVLTKSMADKLFGDVNPVGRVISFNNQGDYRITGVVNDVPHNSHFHFDLLVSLNTLASRFKNWGWGMNPVYTYVLLRKGADAKKFGSEISNLYYKNTGDNTVTYTYTLQPLTSVHLYSHRQFEIEPNGDPAYVFVMPIIALLVLLIACFNYINLTTARYTTRAKEVAVRRVTGAKPREIVVEFLTESTVLALVAFLLAVSAIELLLPAINRLTGSYLSLSIFSSPWQWTELLGLVVLTGVVAGAYPGIFYSRFSPSLILRKSTKVGGTSISLRKVLIVFQFAISAALIISAIVISNQMSYVRQKNIGYNREGVIVIPLRNNATLSSVESFRNRLLENSDILDAALSSTLPTKFFDSQEILPQGYPPNSLWSANYMFVGYSFLSTMKMQMAEGRWFSAKFATDSNAYVINQAAARKLGWPSPIGRTLNMDDITGPVIGVVKDFNFASLHEEVEPLVMTPVRYRGEAGFLSVRIRSTDVANTISFLANSWKQAFPGWAFNYSFLDNDFQNLYVSDQRFATISSLSSVLAILVACLGLLGLISLIAQQRTKEVGVRKVLGASTINIIWTLTKDFLILAVVANFVAWPVAYFALQEWLQSFAYRIIPSVWTFVLAGLIVLVISLMTVGYQAVKAATANPVESLRYE